MQERTWQCPALEDALNKCRETYSGKGPDYSYKYLLARYEYHKLLVSHGLTDQMLAEPKPKA